MNKVNSHPSNKRNNLFSISVLILGYFLISTNGLIDHFLPVPVTDPHKPWIAYVNRALLESINRYKYQSYILTIKHIVRCSLTFWGKNIEELRRVCRNEYCLKYDDPLLRPIGSHTFDSKWNYVQCNYEEYTPDDRSLQIAIWYIRLDLALTLNITFTYFEIQDVHDNCLSGNMTIEYLITRTKSELFPYCGFLAIFTHYTSFPFIYLDVRYFPDIKVRITFQFSVMSPRRISNRPKNNDDPTILFIHVINPLRLVVMTFYLQVIKIQVITLRISDWKSSSEYRIIDGPLLSGEFMKLNDSTFTGTSFQVILQRPHTLEYNTIVYLGHFILDDNQTGSTIQYGGIDTPSKEIEIKNRKEVEIIDIPGDTCLANTTRYCKLHFRGHDQQHINLFILSLNFVGTSTSDCTYGGMAFYEDRQHIMDTCKDYGIYRPARNIYSINSSLTIVIHTYNNFFIQLKMRVSLTRCQPVRLHVFELYEQCGFLGYRNSSDECKLVLTSLNFSPEFHVKIVRNTLVYSLQLETCVILMAANDFLKPNSFHAWNATNRISFVGLYFEVITKPNRIIQYYDKLYFTLFEVIQDWYINIPTGSSIALYEHTLNIMECIPVGSRDCAAFDRTLHYINFNRFDNRTTPTLSKERLYFYLYKGSVFEHEIHIEYFHLKQEVDNVHFVSLDKNGVPLVGASSSFNYYTLVFMVKDGLYVSQKQYTFPKPTLCCDNLLYKPVRSQILLFAKDF